MTSENDSSRRRKASWSVFGGSCQSQPGLGCTAQLSRSSSPGDGDPPLDPLLSPLHSFPSPITVSFLGILFPFQKTLGVCLLALKKD